MLTEKDKLGLWYIPGQENLEEGKDYALLTKGYDGSMKPIVWGKALKMDPPLELHTTFCIEPFAGAETILKWRLQDAAGGMRLSLEHEGINGEELEATR